MFPPPPKLKINELPHHECLGNANGCQDSNSEDIKVNKQKSEYIKAMPSNAVFYLALTGL